MTPARWLRAGVVFTLGLLGLRWTLGTSLGFADAEALYACHAMHPQPGYLDHPGLVGQLLRWLGGGTAPSPTTAHRFAAVGASALPWFGAWMARATGARPEATLRTGFALALVPEMSIGLFSVSPDLPLAYCWLAALGMGALALRSDPGSSRALFASLAAGAAAGFAILSKMSGMLLALSLISALFTPAGRRHLRSVGPWLGMLLGALLLSPLFAWERAQGYPMLTHRFVTTQAAAGLSLRNLAALAGGQLLYVTPPFLFAAWHVFSAIRISTDPVLRWLRLATWITGAPLVALCLWSRVAEPHWVAPAYLGLALAAAHVDPPSVRVVRTAAGLGTFAIALAFVWVGTSLAPRFLGDAYRPRYDLANDLHAWTPALDTLETMIHKVETETGAVPVLVGPHWIVCAQIHALLRERVPVACRTPHGDDFQRWLPEARWTETRVVLAVDDDRFDDESRRRMPGRREVDRARVKVFRGGRVVRTIRIVRFDREEGTAGW